MKVRKLDKMPKRKVTVDDLLEVDNIKRIIGDIDAIKNDLDELLVIYSERNARSFTWITSGLKDSRIIYMCEAVKYSLLGDKDK